MTQTEINKLWERTYTGKGGSITLLESPLTTPPGLRKPYHVELNTYEVNRMIEGLKQIASGVKDKCQCDLIDRKGLTYGTRINIFFLGYRPEFTGDETGITETDWNKLVAEIRTCLELYLGDKALPYAEPFSDKEKFQLRFEIYIKHVK